MLSDGSVGSSGFLLYWYISNSLHRLQNKAIMVNKLWGKPSICGMYSIYLDRNDTQTDCIRLNSFLDFARHPDF